MTLKSLNSLSPDPSTSCSSRFIQQFPNHIPNNSAVHLVGHYCRQEDFDQEPFSDSDDENPYGDSDDEEIDSDFEGDYDMEEGLSGLLGEDDDEEDSEAERFVELPFVPFPVLNFLLRIFLTKYTTTDPRRG